LWQEAAEYHLVQYQQHWLVICTVKVAATEAVGFGNMWGEGAVLTSHHLHLLLPNHCPFYAQADWARQSQLS
jgi:hypothetical protein